MDYAVMKNNATIFKHKLEENFVTRVFYLFYYGSGN